MHRYVWLTESSRTPALWRHDPDVNHQNVLSSLYQGVLTCLQKNIWHQNAMIKSTPIWQRRSKYSKQVRFFLVNVLFVFVTARSLNCTFTDFLHCIDSIYATAWPRRYSEPEILLAKLQQQRPNNSHRKTHLHLSFCVINACWDDILQYVYAPLLCLESCQSLMLLHKYDASHWFCRSLSRFE